MNLASLAKRPQLTRITIESIYSTVTVEVPEADLTFNEFFEDVLEPALMAHGYSRETIESFWGGDNYSCTPIAPDPPPGSQAIFGAHIVNGKSSRYAKTPTTTA